MAQESLLGLMVVNMMANISTIKSRVKEYFNGQMEEDMKVVG